MEYTEKTTVIVQWKISPFNYCSPVFFSLLPKPLVRFILIQYSTWHSLEILSELYLGSSCNSHLWLPGRFYANGTRVPQRPDKSPLHWYLRKPGPIETSFLSTHMNLFFAALHWCKKLQTMHCCAGWFRNMLEPGAAKPLTGLRAKF